MADVKITVLMPCYNAGEYISEAISSVLNQTFRDFELLIVNDGSTDKTAEIIRSFNDSRIVLIEQQQQGVAAALNTGLQHAKADYIARFDADDICRPERLQLQYDFITANPEYIVVGCAADYIDEAGNYIFTHRPKAYSNKEIRRLPFKVCPFIHAGVLYKKEAVAAIGYNVHAHSFEDHLLWLQLKKRGKMYNMHEHLLSVRLNAGSLTIDEKKRPKDFRILKNNALKTLHITEEEGNRLLEIIKKQDNQKQKDAAYHSLLAKKFLWNNYDPPKARQNMKKAIMFGRFDIKDYLLLFISYLPKKIIMNIYSVFASEK